MSNGSGRSGVRSGEAAGRGASSTAQAGPDARIFDAAIYEDVRSLLGREGTVRLLEHLAGDLRTRLEGIDEVPDGSRDRALLAAHAHALVSAAGLLGFTDLAAICRTVEAASAGGHGLDEPLGRLSLARDDALDRIARLSEAA